jgi:hypothetical protein
VDLSTFTIPRFTAERSLYTSARHYRTTCTAVNAVAALADVTGLIVQPQQGNCCGDPGGCCHSYQVCMIHPDGSFAGCCYGTPCYDAGGDPIDCCQGNDVCCGENGCKSASTDNCTACGDPCPDTRTCCSPARGKPFCTDTSADATNCGACFNKCPSGYPCVGGRCIPPSELCNGAVCKKDQICLGGSCCLPVNSSSLCVSNSDCCSGWCNENHQCDCFDIGDPCELGPKSCCSGHCSASSLTCCSPIGATCISDNTCCSGFCNKDRQCDCIPSGGGCVSDDICCSGSCNEDRQCD